MRRSSLPRLPVMDNGKHLAYIVHFRRALSLILISAATSLFAIPWGFFFFMADSSPMPRIRRTILYANQPLSTPKPFIVPQSSITVSEFFTKFYDDRKCLQGWRSLACYKEIVSMAKSRARNNVVTLIVVTDKSTESLINWCASQRAIDADNYIIVALDEEAYRYLYDRGAPVAMLQYGQEKNSTSINVLKKSVWVKRTLTSYMILREGIDVLINDADAVSVKSPFTSRLSFFQYPTLDIISSPSNYPNPERGELPSSCPTLPIGQREWRHQPCMGWILLRSSQNMLQFYEKMFLKDTITFQDDQIGLNCALRRARAKWHDYEWNDNKTMLTQLENPLLSLMMLPASQFIRNCTKAGPGSGKSHGLANFEIDKVQMYHCKGPEKEKNAKANGFWYLKKRWKIVNSTTRSWHSFIDSVTANTK